MDLGPRVSRKKEFVPPLTTAVVKGGWVMPKAALTADPHGTTVLVVDHTVAALCLKGFHLVILTSMANI